MKNKLKKQVIEKIKKENIKPKPRWVFALRYGVVLFAFVFALLFASFIFIAGAKVFLMSDFELARYISGGAFWHFLKMAGPVFVGFLILAFVFAKEFLRASKYGHRISATKLSLLLLILFVAFSSLVYTLDINRKLDRVILPAIFGKSFEEYKFKTWHNPNKGFVSGITLENSFKAQEKQIKLIDSKGVIWTLNLANLDKQSAIALELADKVVVFGSVDKDARKINACAVKPLMLEKEKRQKLLDTLKKEGPISNEGYKSERKSFIERINKCKEQKLLEN